MARAPLALALAGALAACGQGDGPAGPPPEDWPLTFEVPAVLGYAAGVTEGLAAEALRGLGWDAEGLDPTRPEVLLMLDAMVLGAPVALVLPVTDADALLASLGRCPLVEPLGDGRYRVTLPADHPLRQAVRVLKGGQGIGSVGDLMAVLDDASPLTVTLTAQARDDWVLLVPSFEATLVARQVLAALPVQLARPGMVRAALDLDRVADTFHDELQRLDQQLQGLVGLGASAGVGALVAAGMRSRPSSERLLPASPQFLWMLWKLLDNEGLTAVGLELTGAPWRGPSRRPPPAGAAPGSRPADELGATPSGLVTFMLDLRRGEPSAITAVCSTLRPAGDPGEGLWLEAEPGAFADALATWLVPLAEFVKGAGAPSVAWLDELRELLAPWSGRLVLRRIDDGAVLVLGTRPGQRFDGEGWSAWLDTLVDAAGVEPGVGPASLLGDGELEPAWHEQGLVLVGGELGAGRLEAFLDELARTSLPADGPVLRARLQGSELSLSVPNETDARLDLRFEPEALEGW